MIFLYTIYLFNTINWFLMVLLFSMLFNVYTPKIFREKPEKFQLFISILMLIISVLRLIFSWLFLSFDSLFNLEYLTIYLFVDCIILISSVFKYKTTGSVPNVVFNLGRDDYKLNVEMDFLGYDLLNKIPVERIKKTAVLQDKLLVFLGSSPDVEIDAIFICKEVSKNVYQVNSYEKIGPYAFKDIISILFSYLCLIIFCWLGIVINIMDFLFMKNGYVEEKIFVSPLLIAFGVLVVKLFKSHKGLVGYLYKLLGILMAIAGVIYIFM